MKKKLSIFLICFALTVFGMSLMAFADGCLTFTGESGPFTLSGTYVKWDETLEYSTDLSTWTIWNGSEIASSQSAPYVLYLRGKDNYYVTGKSDFDNAGVEKKRGLYLSARASCSGNIMTLLNYSNPDSYFKTEHAFDGLFGGCNNLISAPSLPATTLTSFCYNQMFSGCTSLTSVPSLPATSLAHGCYRYMFSGCTNLKSAPALPATSLADCCYEGMFWGCTSLKSAPALPATTLAWGCYDHMFYGCTSLTSAPALPAKTVEHGCYFNMFNKCTSLTSAPALPATTVAEYCYEGMFCNCTSLTSAPALPATTLAKECYEDMFLGCESLKSAPVLPATTLAEKCYSWMFSGCTNLTSVPALPARTLAESCYEAMFRSCTSLTSVPALPATKLAKNCYSEMFIHCTGILLSDEKGTFNGITYGKEYRIPSAGTGIVAADSLTDMFGYTGGRFTGTPEINKTYYLKGGVTEPTNSETVEKKGAAVKVTLSKTKLTYNGKTQKPGITVKDGKKKLTTSSYTVTWPKSVNPGEYTVTVKLKNGYSGAKKAKYVILPKGTMINKLIVGKKQLTVKWKKQPKQITGYQISYSLNSKFKDAKTVTVKGTKKTSAKIKKLKRGKVYFVRIRTYKKVGKKTLCSTWSKTKKMKTK